MIDPNSKEIVQRKSALKQAEKCSRPDSSTGKYACTDVEHRNKLIAATVDKIVDTYRKLIDYYDTEFKHLTRPALFWPDGKSLGFGFASHMSGSAQKFYKIFEYWGFKDLTEFYSLPRLQRNRFMAEAAAYWKSLFGERGGKLKVILLDPSILGEELYDMVKDSEYTLRAGLLLLADSIKEDARKHGWNQEKSRRIAKLEFERPFGFSPGYYLKRAAEELK